MPVNEYGQIIGESMEGYTPGDCLPLISQKGATLGQRLFRWKSMREDLLAVYGPDTPPGDVDLSLSGTSGRYGGAGQPFKSDVGS